MQAYNPITQKVVYAGFWARLSAYLIDLVLVWMGQLLVRLVLFLMFGFFWEQNPLDWTFLFQYTFRDAILYGAGVTYFILCTYYAGATLGKKALNLKVVSAEGSKLSFLDVLYRETIGRFLSAFVLGIGYLLVGLTNEKKGLHDILCDTRVVYEKKIPTYANGDINKRYVQTVPTVPPVSSGSTGPDVPVPPPPIGTPPAAGPDAPMQDKPPVPPSMQPPQQRRDIADRYMHVEPRKDREK